MSATKEPKPVPWPPSDPETEAAIGRVMLAWGILEREIDESIAAVYRLDTVASASITANLGTKAKLDICQAGIHTLKGEFDETPDIVAMIDELTNKTSAASANWRLMVAHGQPWLVEHPDGDMWILARSSARKGGVRMHIQHFTAESFIDALAGIKALVDRWFEFRLAVGKSEDFRSHLVTGW